MSAKWRRNGKNSKRLNIFRVFNNIKDKNTPKVVRIKSFKIKGKAYPYKHKVNVQEKKKWREPKPLIDVLEEKNDLIIVAELAGFGSEDLRIHAKNQRLTLSAEALNRKYHKSLNLPTVVIPNTIRTTYKNGVLEIRLRKSVEEKTINNIMG